MNIYLEEEKGDRKLIWTIDDSYVKAQENEKWFEGQVKMEAGNQNKNYRVRKKSELKGLGLKSKLLPLDLTKSS